MKKAKTKKVLVPPNMVATEFLTETWEVGQVLALNASASLFKSTANIHAPSLFETAKNLAGPDDKPDTILVLYLGMSNLVDWMSQILRDTVPPRGVKVLPLAKILVNEATWFVDPSYLTAKLPSISSLLVVGVEEVKEEDKKSV